MVRNRRFAFLLASLLFPFGANAAELVFEFTGKVLYGGTFAPVGAPVTGSFSYDTKTDPWFEIGSDAFYLIPEPHYIEVSVAGHLAIGAGLNINVTDDAGGNAEDVVNIYSSGAMVDGVFAPQGTVGVVFGSGPGSTHALHDTRLPARYDLDRFDVWGGNGGVVTIDGSGPDPYLVQFSIESIVQRRICNDRGGGERRPCVVR